MPRPKANSRPAEVFGHPTTDSSDQAQRDRQRHWCPFVDKLCWKQSRLIDYPFGVCSVNYRAGTVAVCPTRFLQNNTAFADIAEHCFGTRDNIVPCSEVSVTARGRDGRGVKYIFDYVLVKHKALSAAIDDFCVVEFQTVDTTSTGKLVQALADLMAGVDIQSKSYRFGMNWANVWKRCFTQILRKGTILERWQHHIYWVAQEPAYRHLLNSYGLHDLAYEPSERTVFQIYDLEPANAGYRMMATRTESATVETLFRAFQNSVPIPPKDAFLEALQLKVAEKLPEHLRLRLETD